MVSLLELGWRDLYKTELIRRRKRWHSLEELELATAEWVSWWNERRLHSACGGR